jgi:hypothetical protein
MPDIATDIAWIKSSAYDSSGSRATDIIAADIPDPTSTRLASSINHTLIQHSYQQPQILLRQTSANQ